MAPLTGKVLSVALLVFLLIPTDFFLFCSVLYPAGMCASQVRATPFLRQGKEMDNLKNGC